MPPKKDAAVKEAEKAVAKAKKEVEKAEKAAAKAEKRLAKSTGGGASRKASSAIRRSSSSSENRAKRKTRTKKTNSAPWRLAFPIAPTNALPPLEFPSVPYGPVGGIEVFEKMQSDAALEHQHIMSKVQFLTQVINADRPTIQSTLLFLIDDERTTVPGPDKDFKRQKIEWLQTRLSSPAEIVGLTKQLNTLKADLAEAVGIHRGALAAIADMHAHGHRS